MRIVVYGMPAPQGSKKFVGLAKSTGRGILVESSKKVKPWRQDVKAAATDAIKLHEATHGETWRKLDCPLFVRIMFTLPKPASAPKVKKTYAMRKPDLSKLVRSTEDALTDAGLWADDARVVSMYVEKTFPSEMPTWSAMDADFLLPVPGCVIEIETE